MKSKCDQRISQKKNGINNNNCNTSNIDIELNQVNNILNPKQCLVEMLNTSRQGYVESKNDIMSTEIANTQFSELSQNIKIQQV